MKFSDENKEVKEFSDSNYFGYGVHHVHVGAVELGETDNGKEYIALTVLGDNGEEATARVWFSTDKAANYSFNTLRQIAVHNAKDDAKDAMRDACDAVDDTEALVALLNEEVIGGDCWYTKYPDPSRTYQASDGTVRPSNNENVYGYEPKLNPALMPKDQKALSADDFPGDEEPDADAASKVPANWN